MNPKAAKTFIDVRANNEVLLNGWAEMGLRIAYIANIYEPRVYRCYSPWKEIEKRFINVHDLYKKKDLYEYNPLLEDVIKRKNKRLNK
jgi:hypothetical protein